MKKEYILLFLLFSLVVPSICLADNDSISEDVEQDFIVSEVTKYYNP